MSFKAAKCPNCAGDLQVPDDRDSVKCMYCGNDIIVRDAIKAAAGGVNIENLLKLAKDAENIGDLGKAQSYFLKILEYNSMNAEANLGNVITTLFLNSHSYDSAKSFIRNLIHSSQDKEIIKKLIKDRIIKIMRKNLRPEYNTIDLISGYGPKFRFIHEAVDENDICGLLAVGYSKLRFEDEAAFSYFEKAVVLSGKDTKVVEKLGSFFMESLQPLRECSGDGKKEYCKAQPLLDFYHKFDTQNTFIEEYVISNIYNSKEKKEVCEKLVKNVQLFNPNYNPPKVQKSSQSSCFIATATYGSPIASEVVLLQNFRDKHLESSSFGRIFIKSYYRLSPPLAKIISNSNLLKAISRQILRPLIFAVKFFHNGQN